MGKELKLITHSMVQCFQDCRVKYDYRYNNGIVPSQSVTALDFGSAIHTGLEFWFRYGVKQGAVDIALEKGAKFGLDVGELIKIRVLMERYCDTYAVEDFEIIFVEKSFDLPLLNPMTGRVSRTFRFNGKVDGIVMRDDKIWILEHKTTSSISDAYLERIDIDTQIALYASALEKLIGKHVVGAIYDIIEKPSIRWKSGETDEEFEARRAELIAKSKTGKTTAKKQEPDTYDSFFERCHQNVTKDNFHRVEVIIDENRKRDALQNLWKTAKDINGARIYPNTGNCMRFGQSCPYLDLCRARGDISLCGDMYTNMRPHIELDDSMEETSL